VNDLLLYFVFVDPCCGSIPAIYSAMDPSDPYHTAKLVVPAGISLTGRDCDSLAPQYPCYATSLSCYVDLKKNRNFADVMNSKINTSCNCAAIKPGYVWDPIAHFCVGMYFV